MSITEKLTPNGLVVGLILEDEGGASSEAVEAVEMAEETAETKQTKPKTTKRVKKQ